jgi:phospholipid transport system transporter-binding protein
MRVEAGVAAFEGDLILDNATRFLAEAEAVLGEGVTVFDLSRVGNMDSSALSLMLSLRRRAAGNPIEFRAVPESLTSLAKLYGIADQL